MRRVASIAAWSSAGLASLCLTLAPAPTSAQTWTQPTMERPTYDRYGPPAVSVAASPEAAPVQAAAPAVIGRRILTWSGKDDAPAPVPATARPLPALAVRTPVPRPTAAPTPTPRPAVRPGALGPPQRPWTDRIARTTPTAAAPAPTSIYDPAAYAAAPAPTPFSAPVPGGTARYYSLHRAYGVTPDPAPIPPAFFGPTVDFTAPETQDPVRRASATTAAASTKSAVNAARVDSETAQ